MRIAALVLLALALVGSLSYCRVRVVVAERRLPPRATPHRSIILTPDETSRGCVIYKLLPDHLIALVCPRQPVQEFCDVDFNEQPEPATPYTGIVRGGRLVACEDPTDADIEADYVRDGL